jgi:hypothetical protein
VLLIYGEVFNVSNTIAARPFLIRYEYLRVLVLCILSVVAVLLKLSVEIIVSNENIAF